MNNICVREAQTAPLFHVETSELHDQTSKLCLMWTCTQKHGPNMTCTVGASQEATITHLGITVWCRLKSTISTMYLRDVLGSIRRCEYFCPTVFKGNTKIWKMTTLTCWWCWRRERKLRRPHRIFPPCSRAERGPTDKQTLKYQHSQHDQRMYTEYVSVGCLLY